MRDLPGSARLLLLLLVCLLCCCLQQESDQKKVSFACKGVVRCMHARHEHPPLCVNGCW